MRSTIIGILSLLTTLLPACSGSNHTGPDAAIVERIVAQQSSSSMIALAEHAIDSIAMLPIDTLDASSHKRVPILVREICKALKERNLTDAAAAVAAYPYGIDAAQNRQIAMRLLTATLLPGTDAPTIEGLSATKQQPKYTIVFFHESTCRTCQGIVWELKERYDELQKARVRIVSISTDTNKELWTDYAATLPWSDKLCSLKGFQSSLMEAYGVAATPTMYLVDAKGRVVDQYATAEEIANIVLPKSTPQ